MKPERWIVDWDVQDGWNHHVYIEGTDDRVCFMAHDPANQDASDRRATTAAAAPEMLDVLKETVAKCSHLFDATAIREVIAKAEKGWL